MDKQLAQKAAQWWADKISVPAKLDNGDRSDTGVYTMMVATILQAKERTGITPEKVNKFRDELRKALQNETRPWITVSVDYHPDTYLSNAAEKAGINPGMGYFPWKTVMSIHEGKVTVSEGYGAEYVEI